MPLLVLLSGSTASQPDNSLSNLLMAIYVGLTLVLAIVAVISIVISSRLSRDALAASDRQSKEAIEAVQKQIDASERQAQEALYNQHKPIVIPINNSISKDMVSDVIIRHHSTLQIVIGLQNKGAGVALNTFAITAVDGISQVFCLPSTGILSQDADVPKDFDFNAGVRKYRYPYDEFEGVPVFPQGVFGFARLMVTYSDIFDNRYLGVFDYSDEFGWRMLNDVKRVTKRLDELVIIQRY